MTKLFAGGDDAMQHYMKTIPLGRLGTKWDIAMAVNYLCSELLKALCYLRKMENRDLDDEVAQTATYFQLEAYPSSL